MGRRRIFTPSLGPSSWRGFLADPFVQWRREKSAWELAVAWESAAKLASGIPGDVQEALQSADRFRDAELIAAIPEHRVELDDPKRPSQNDLWLILWTPAGYASVTIEAKAGEEFDKPIETWLQQESDGKKRRLRFLAEALGIETVPPGHIRYQLVHRAASAVLEARRCHFPLALMLVQSFGESPTSWKDYCAFLELFRVEGKRGAIAGPSLLGDLELHFGWVDAPKASDAVAVEAL